MEAQRMTDCAITEFVTPIGALVVYELSCAAREPIDARIEQIVGQFPPAGYGTRFTGPVLADDGRWRAHGQRARSCD